MSFAPWLSLSLLLVPGAIGAESLHAWTDVTAESGLDGHAYSLVKFADLNGNGWPDVILMPGAREDRVPRVFLHPGAPARSDQRLPRYEEKRNTGLPAMRQGDVLVFADLDNNGITDAVIGRYLDIYQDDYQPREEEPTRTAWLPGRGDGTFGPAQVIDQARLATTRAIAIGDVNADGLPDILIGNWYERYFTGYEAFANDLLLQFRGPDDEPDFVRWPLPEETRPTDYHSDAGGRPTYGVALPRLDDGLPMLLELNYGRRWNRLYQLEHREPFRLPGRLEPPDAAPPRDPRAAGDHLVRQLRGQDIAPEVHVDGDAIRHGRHPAWPTAHADAQPRSRRPDEPPFRANGNTFDVAIGDIDNDGDFDLFVTTIIHAWAGESSDRSRFLVNQLKETGKLDFVSFDHLSVDRIPDLPEPGEPLELIHTQHNQGDIYAELADLNHNGRLDLILCSSDYADPPPFEERLRIFFQQEDGRFKDVTAELGIDHVGAGMPSLADVDGDGALDLLVGQSFNRLTAEQRREAALVSGALTPESPADAPAEIRMRLFRNGSTEGRASLMLDLTGDPSSGVTREALGTIVRVTANIDGDPDTPEVTQIRQVLGPSGHAGKQSSFTVHFGLGEATAASLVEVIWPGDGNEPTRLVDLPAGRYWLDQSDPTTEPRHH